MTPERLLRTAVVPPIGFALPKRRAVRQALAYVQGTGSNRAQAAAPSPSSVYHYPCAECGRGGCVLHHDDYARPTDVVPLCRSCHLTRHRAIRVAFEGLLVDEQCAIVKRVATAVVRVSRELYDPRSRGRKPAWLNPSRKARR